MAQHFCSCAHRAEKRGLTPRAVITGHNLCRQAKSLLTAPIGAIRKPSGKTGWDLKDIDLFEINEAFAVVAMAAMRDLDLPHDKVNIRRRLALGHPIGASGARILVTLLAALPETHGLKRGIGHLPWRRRGNRNGYRKDHPMLLTDAEQIREAARDFAQERLAPGAAARDREHAFRAELTEMEARFGFLGMLVPPEWARSDLGMVAYARRWKR